MHVEAVKQTKAQFVYKCRLCGTVYHVDLPEPVHDMCHELRYARTDPVDNVVQHKCDPFSCGLADLQGIVEIQ